MQWRRKAVKVDQEGDKFLIGAKSLSSSRESAGKISVCLYVCFMSSLPVGDTKFMRNKKGM